MGIQAIDLFDIEYPTRKQLYEALFRPTGWEKCWYSGLALLDFGISEDEYVLDVGGGNKPFPRANVVVERYLKDSSQRGDKEVVSLPGQKLVIADASALPFKDNEFDFIYTSHTLEHVDDLPSAIEELSRVGKRGYCALPLGEYSPYTDVAGQGHKWMCRYENGVFYVRRKEKWEYCYDLGRYHEFLHVNNMVLKGVAPYLFLFEQKYRYVWEIRFVWKDKVRYEVLT
jgi:hypothetical protein